MAWYQVKGNDSDTVISSRIRLARNLSGFAFDKKLSVERANEMIDLVCKALDGEGFLKIDMSELDDLHKQSLVEEHLISRELAAKKSPAALLRRDAESLSLMLSEEDHIRLQCILPGLALRDAYRFAHKVDERLDERLDIAFDEQLGYLTHCPTNLGTGMRASVMLFLPALTKGGYIPSLTHQLSKLGLTVRGLYGEGSASHASIWQISNQITLGISEEDILRKLEDAVATIIEKERSLRREVSEEAAALREDKIHRAEGILRYATRLSTEEFFSLYTDLKLGVALGIITSIDDTTLNTLLISILPATLSLRAEEMPKNAFMRDAYRAKFIKNALEVSRK